MMDIKEAVIQACEYDSLSDALTSIALWKTFNDDVISWGDCFDRILEEHPKARLRKTDAAVKMHLSKIPVIDGIFRSFNSKDYYIAVEEHGLIRNTYGLALENVENLFNVDLSIRAHQGRDILNTFSGLEKIWIRGED